uniref:Uncharacterized protein n=1 Tax=Callithrix jacchus TaxID=9483 RepID=A0A5F4WFC9_CALJA
ADFWEARHRSYLHSRRGDCTKVKLQERDNRFTSQTHSRWAKSSCHCRFESCTFLPPPSWSWNRSWGGESAGRTWMKQGGTCLSHSPLALLHLGPGQHKAGA